jgi:hypothetical protein
MNFSYSLMIYELHFKQEFSRWCCSRNGRRKNCLFDKEERNDKKQGSLPHHFCATSGDVGSDIARGTN